jgi:hypothetical protein
MGTFKWSVVRRDSVSVSCRPKTIPNPLTEACLDAARRVLRVARRPRPTWVSCSTRWRDWPVSSVEEFSVATATYQRLPFPNDSIPLYRCDLLSHLAAIPTGVDGTVQSFRQHRALRHVFCFRSCCLLRGRNGVG